MKNFFLILVLSLLSIKKVNGQDSSTHRYRDSLRQKLATEHVDTSKVNIYWNIGWSFVFFDEDSAAHFAKKGLDLARKINYKYGEANCPLAFVFFILTSWKFSRRRRFWIERARVG